MAWCRAIDALFLSVLRPPEDTGTMVPLSVSSRRRQTSPVCASFRRFRYSPHPRTATMPDACASSRSGDSNRLVGGLLITMRHHRDVPRLDIVALLANGAVRVSPRARLRMQTLIPRAAS
jgi:hypothetical protein